MTHQFRRRGPLALAAGIVAFALTLAGCSGGSSGGDTSGGEPVAGGILRVAQPDEPTSLDPATGTSGSDLTLLYSIYDTLVDYDPRTLEPIPNQVESWTYEDSTHLVLTLHDGIEFSDGTPLDAEAVKFNIERIFSTPEAKAVATDIGAIQSVEVVDDLTVRLVLSTPDPSLLIKFADRAGMMVSPTAAADPAKPLDQNPVGSGAFVLQSWQPNDRVTLERNDNYWQEGLPYLDGIVYQKLDVTAAVNALESGQIDILPPEVRIEKVDRDRLVATPGIASDSMDAGLFTHHIYFNRSRAPFDDLRVRQAVNLALDRDAIKQAIYGDEGEVMKELVPSGHFAYSDIDTDDYSLDLDRARDLLADAGYPDGLEVRLLTTTEPVRVRMAEIVKAQLAEIGIDATIRQVEIVPSLAAFFEEQTDDMYLMGWSGRLHPIQSYTAIYSTNAYFNAGNATIPGFDEALEAIKEVPEDDTAARDAAWREMNQLILDEAPIAPLVFLPNAALFRDTVHDFSTNLLLKPKYRDVWLSPQG